MKHKPIISCLSIEYGFVDTSCVLHIHALLLPYSGKMIQLNIGIAECCGVEYCGSYLDERKGYGSDSCAAYTCKKRSGKNRRLKSRVE